MSPYISSGDDDEASENHNFTKEARNLSRLSNVKSRKIRSPGHRRGV